MRDFGKVPASLWDRDELSFHTKALYAYLLSNKHSNYIGCYECKDGYITADAGITKAALAKSFAQLDEAGMAKRYGRVVYLPGFVTQNIPTTEGQAASRMEAWRELPDCEAKALVADEMVRSYDKLSNADGAELEAYTGAITKEEFEALKAQGFKGLRILESESKSEPKSQGESQPKSELESQPQSRPLESRE